MRYDGNGFKPGVSGNPAGRPKGALNKANAPIKGILENFARAELPRLLSTYSRLENIDQWRLMDRILSYLVAKPRDTLEVQLGTSVKDLSNEQLDQLLDRILEKNGK